MKQKKITKPTQEEFDAMTNDQKRLVIIQLRQQDTMDWQKQAAVIQVYSFIIGLFVFIGWLAMAYNKSQH